MEILKFLSDSYHEVSNNVSWLSGRELENTTAIVLLMVAIISIIVGCFDIILKLSITHLYNLI